MPRRRHGWSWCTSYWRCQTMFWRSPKYCRRLVETVPTVWGNRLWSGRPRVTYIRQNTYIRVFHFCERLRTASLRASSFPGLRRISPRTVRYRVRERVRERGIRQRLAWCRRHIYFTHQTGHVFFSRMSPGSISTAGTAVLECTVVLVNISITVVWLNDVHSAEVVSWCGVASHPVVEQHVWF